MTFSQFFFIGSNLFHYPLFLFLCGCGSFSVYILLLDGFIHSHCSSQLRVCEWLSILNLQYRFFSLSSHIFLPYVSISTGTEFYVFIMKLNVFPKYDHPSSFSSKEVESLQFSQLLFTSQNQLIRESCRLHVIISCICHDLSALLLVQGHIVPSCQFPPIFIAELSELISRFLSHFLLINSTTGIIFLEFLSVMVPLSLETSKDLHFSPSYPGLNPLTLSG